MPEQTITQPTATTYLVEDLVSELLSGRVRVPEFQRSLRWQWEDVRRLFDSIVRGYPIGSLLLWIRPAEAATVQIGTLRIDAPEYNEALWVVDGQQRLTSLACVLSDEGERDRFALAYDLRKRRFDHPNDDTFRLQLPLLFDLQRLLGWFAEHPEAKEFLGEATRVTKAIRHYRVPAYIVKQEDESVLRDIFDRMNNYGKRLSRAEVFSALHSTGGSSRKPRTLSDIAEHLDVSFGFGPLDEDTVLRAFLARRGPDVTREIRTEFESDRVSREFGGESPEDASRSTQEALERVIEFLQNDACVPHFGLLSYRYLLVVLARFFAHHPAPAQRNLDLLRRWFWRAAMVGPNIARGSYTSAMRTLAACVHADSESRSVQGLLAAVSDFQPTFTMPKRYKSTTAEVRFVLCALWSLHPRSVLTGEQYDREALAESLRGRRTANDSLAILLPRAANGRGRIGNRVFVLGDDDATATRERLAERPLDLTAEQWGAVLESHALDETMAGLLQRDAAEDFLAGREAHVERVTRSFLERVTETHLEDTPPLEDFDLDEDETEEAPQ